MVVFALQRSSREMSCGKDAWLGRKSTKAFILQRSLQESKLWQARGELGRRGVMEGCVWEEIKALG